MLKQLKIRPLFFKPPPKKRCFFLIPTPLCHEIIFSEVFHLLFLFEWSGCGGATWGGLKGGTSSFDEWNHGGNLGILWVSQLFFQLRSIRWRNPCINSRVFHSSHLRSNGSAVGNKATCRYF